MYMCVCVSINFTHNGDYPKNLQGSLKLSNLRPDLYITLQKVVVLYTCRVFWFSLQALSETVSILKRIERNIVINVQRLHVKYPLFLSDSNETLIFPNRFSKNNQISNFIKIRSVKAELLQADGRTDTHDEANGRSPQFCKRT